MTTGVMTAGTPVRRPGTGRGRRAAQLQSADLAAQISNFASVAAALCSALGAHRVDVARLTPLIVRAEQFAALIDDLESLDPETLRTYRELVPFKVWRKGIDRVQIGEGLAVHVRNLIANINSGTVSDDTLQRDSEMFDELADSFQSLGRQLLSQATEQVPSD